MQKLLIATVIGTLALTGCAKDTATETSTPTQAEHVKGGKPHHHHTHMDKKGHGYQGTHPHFYVCEKDVKLIAHPDTESEIMKINVTAPSLKLERQDIELKLAPSASGERYVNDTNPASIYEWHAKGHEGVFSVNVGGTDYQYSCEIKPFKPPFKKPMLHKAPQVENAQ